jgi:hypothetical protein
LKHVYFRVAGPRTVIFRDMPGLETILNGPKNPFHYLVGITGLQALDWAHSIKMADSAFDSTYYYRFSNTALRVNMTLAVGETNDPPNAPVLNPIRSFSSEN